jgi:hypothetical protein
MRAFLWSCFIRSYFCIVVGSIIFKAFLKRIPLFLENCIAQAFFLSESSSMHLSPLGGEISLGGFAAETSAQKAGFCSSSYIKFPRLRLRRNNFE